MAVIPVIKLEECGKVMILQGDFSTGGGPLGGVSPRIGELVFKKNGDDLANGYMGIFPRTIVDGAIDYPLFSSIYTEFVVGDDIVFPPDVEGMFLRNLGGEAEAEGVFQDDATAPNGLNVELQLRRATNTAGGGSSHRFQTTGTFVVPPQVQTITGDPETRPVNRAYQLCAIVDTFPADTVGVAPAAPIDDTVVSDYTSGVGISANQLVYVDPATGTIFPADTTDDLTAGRVLGIATNTVAGAGQTVSVITHGPYQDSGFAFNTALDGCLFANGVLGQFSQTAPSAPEYNLSIGSVLSADTLFVDLGDPIFR